LLAALLVICGPGPRVNRIVDDDTFWLAGEKIRTENIDTPEISKPKCPAETRRW
jgi:endonuclease YncB( thermonuclease family)